MAKRICALLVFIICSLFLFNEGAIFGFDNKDFIARGAVVQPTVRISVCGNNIKEAGEQCDNADLGGATCISQGFAGGTLSCTVACDYNTSACTHGGGGGGGPTPVNGVCGIANNASYYSIPTANLCSVGNPSVVAGSGPWTWTCSGLYGGLTSPACTANKSVNLPDGCTSTSAYSITTGLPCSGATLTAPTLPAGCTSASGYSITTGLSCSGTILATFPAGCTSILGYSITTGLPCSGTILVAPSTPSGGGGCSQYMTSYIKLGAINDPVEVKKLQIFLINYEGFSNLTVTGIYDSATYDAVRKFQLKYANDILAPWGITAPSGWVYTATIRKINELYCKAKTNIQSTDLFIDPLGYGSHNQQVVLLQDTLKKLGFFPKSVGSNGNFGPTTLKAVQDFQVYYNIAKPGNVGYGRVGPNTRRELNKLISQ